MFAKHSSALIITDFILLMRNYFLILVFKQWPFLLFLHHQFVCLLSFVNYFVNFSLKQLLNKRWILP